MWRRIGAGLGVETEYGFGQENQGHIASNTRTEQLLFSRFSPTLLPPIAYAIN
jgi:hypothetical protein